MITLLIAGIIALCAVLVLFRPSFINVLSEDDSKRIDAKKTGRIAFWGLMATALALVALFVLDIRHELAPVFVGILGALITATLIQCSIPME
ncbi:MAG: hypothetical protein IJZ68_14595 [Bacteroidaceae bacterium]|nr:hypothetical protein [Bacteroidaceae bacterium]MBQ8807638.1 hypothetical protein [Bacteroidaceae bacterium]